MIQQDNKCLVIFQPSGRRGYVDSGKTVKEASIALGEAIEGLCSGNGVCGKCSIRVIEGVFDKYGVVSQADHLSPLDLLEEERFSVWEKQNGFRLACSAKILGDVVVVVPEESQIGKQIIRKAPSNININLNPAVKKYYIELPEASLDDSTGDFERLQHELDCKYQLKNLSADYIVLLNLQEIIAESKGKVTASVWQGKEIIRLESGKSEEAYGLAVDVGTTTIAGYLCDLVSGKIVATASLMNPQVVYGEDVISRISYIMTNPDGLQIMNEAVINGLNRLIENICTAKIAYEDIVDMTIVGNTCVHHILLNIDPSPLGRTPYTPAVKSSLYVKARDLGLNAPFRKTCSGFGKFERQGTRIMIAPTAYIHVLPVEAGYVGADNVGVLIAVEPHKQDAMELILDIGTNGELILGNRDRLLCTSCATGPALEGAEIRFGMRAAPGAIEKILIDKESKETRFKVIGENQWSNGIREMGAKGICGSGLIDAVAQLFLAGIIDKTGRFHSNCKSPHFRIVEGKPEFVIAWSKETAISQDIAITQKDIRAIQLAKAAMYAGAKIMMQKLCIKKVDKIILAGAFGSFIDKKSAAVLGLFPDCNFNCVFSVGNAAGDGARAALLDINKRLEADAISQKMEYVELTQMQNFEENFVEAMWIPHMKDSFSHLNQLLLKK